MPSLNESDSIVFRAPATLILVIASTLCFLLFYPLQWVGMLELFNFVPFRAVGGYVAFGELGDDWWRFVTPTLIHFGWLHVVFNCLWLWEFGQRIEHRLGSVNLFGIYIVSAIASNYCQYAWQGPSIFGGMSGVVYAFMGFIMSAHLCRPGWIASPPIAVFGFMILWLIIGMIGSLELIGADAIANGAHVGGLVTGSLLGFFICGLYKSRELG